MEELIKEYLKLNSYFFGEIYDVTYEGTTVVVKFGETYDKEVKTISIWDMIKFLVESGKIK